MFIIFFSLVYHTVTGNVTVLQQGGSFFHLVNLYHHSNALPSLGLLASEEGCEGVGGLSETNPVNACGQQSTSLCSLRTKPFLSFLSFFVVIKERSK